VSEIIRLRVEVDVDAEVWAAENFVDLDDVAEDVRSWLAGTLDDAPGVSSAAVELAS
jgi:hypothetical protein